MRRSVPLLLAGALVACGGSPFEPINPSLDFHGGTVFGIPTLPTKAVPEDGSFLVIGVLQTATTGYTLSGFLSVPSSRTLEIYIDAHPMAPTFPFVSQNYYRARVGDLPSGDYDLSVWDKDHGKPEVPAARVYHQSVLVP